MATNRDEYYLNRIGRMAPNKTNIVVFVKLAILRIIHSIKSDIIRIIRFIFFCSFIVLFTVAICAGASVKEHFTEGIKAANEGNYEKAIEEFEKSIQLDKDDSRPHIALAIVYVNLKEFEKALQYAHQAISIDSGQGIAYYIVGMISEKLKRFDNAIDAWKIYLTLEPKGRKAEIAKKHLKKLTEEMQSP